MWRAIGRQLSETGTRGDARRPDYTRAMQSINSLSDGRRLAWFNGLPGLSPVMTAAWLAVAWLAVA